jgi:hypothetical protein
MIKLKKDIKNNIGQPGLTYQTCDLSHETWITSWKTKQIKSRNLISNESNVKG